MTLSILLAVAGSLALKFDAPLASGPLEPLGEMRRFDVRNPAPMDLSSAAGVKFMMRCADPKALTACWLLFESGDGFYRAAIDVPAEAGVWTERTVLRTAVRLYHWNTHVSLRELYVSPPEEDLPDWSRVTAFRIAFSLVIDRALPDATVSVRDFAPVAFGSHEALAAEKALADREARVEKEVSAFPSRHGERRFLATHVYGLGWNWDSTCKMLARHGITDVIPLTSYGGRSYFKSAFEPPHPLMAVRGDAVRQCIAACRKNGQKCHPWRCCWQLGEILTAEERAKLLDEGRLQVNAEGKADMLNFLCPTHPENIRHEIEALMELAEMGAEGVMLDYFRYPGADFCACLRCRAKFEQSVGHKVEGWPKFTGRDAALKVRWQDFRRTILTDVLRTVRAEMRHRAPQVELSAAVFASAGGRAKFGQDWPAWCREDLLDWLFPMCYYSSSSHLGRDVRPLLDAVAGSKAKVIPMIAIASGGVPFNDPLEIARQISVVREAGCEALAFFRLEEYLPYAFDVLGKGPLK